MSETPDYLLSPRGMRIRAGQSATWRGHSLKWRKEMRRKPRTAMRVGAFGDVPVVLGWREVPRWYGECRRCGATVTVEPEPMPNECSIMGSAVAVGCGD